MGIAEQELLSRYARSKDAEAFRILVEQHQNMVFSTCKRILDNAADAEDVTQECFLRLARSAARLRPPVGAWLHRVAVHAAVAFARRNRSRRAREIRTVNDSHASAEPAWEALKGHIDAAIAQLPGSLRAPVVMHYLEGRKQEEIARELHLTQSAVSKRLERGVAELRRRLKRSGGDSSALALTPLMLAHGTEPAPPTLTASLGKIGLAGVGKSTIPWGGGMVMKIGIAAGVLIAVVASAVIMVRPGVANIEAGKAAPVISPAVPSADPVLGQAAPAVKNEPAAPLILPKLTVPELLTKYRATQSALARFVIKGEAHVIKHNTYTGPRANMPVEVSSDSLVELCYDGNRFRWTRRQWDAGSSPIPGRATEENPEYISILWDGKQLLLLGGSQNVATDVHIRKELPRLGFEEYARADHFDGGALLGRTTDNRIMRIDFVVEHSAWSRVRDQMEKVGDADCYVVEARGERGELILWLDPQHGYNIARWEMDQSRPGLIWTETLKGIRFGQVGGVWLPMEGTHELHLRNLVDGSVGNETRRCTFTEIVLNPNFSALGSFVPKEIKEGAVVYFDGEKNTYPLPDGAWVPIWQWHDGKPVRNEPPEVNTLKH
jgi:RNA polymerase sigma-70 factor (ECF subfamily)